MATALASEYQARKGWQELKNNPGRWHEILRSSLPPVAIEKRGGGERVQSKPSPVSSEYYVQGKAHAMVVFDADKRPVIGGKAWVSDDGYVLKEMIVSGKTVGWLGLYKKEHLSNPLAMGFLKQQSQVLYLIGGGILVLAALVFQHHGANPGTI